MIGLKRKQHLFKAEKIEAISTFQHNLDFRKVFVNKIFKHVQKQKKALSPRHSAYNLSSAKSP